MKNLQELLEGYVVADLRGDHWLTSDINDVSKFVWAGPNAKRTDWPITDHCIQSELEVPDDSGGSDILLCRWSQNSDCDTPYEKEDFFINEEGDVIYIYNSFHLNFKPL